MADDLTAAFNLNVESNAAQVSKDGAAGLANLQEKIGSSVDELRNLNAAFRSLKAGAGVGSEAVKDLQSKIAAQKATLAGQQQAYLKAGGTFKEVSERNKAATTAQAAAEKRARDASLVWSTWRKRDEAAVKKATEQRLSSMHAEIARGAELASATLAVGAAYAALVAAAVAAAAAVFAYGVQVADVRRSELLQLEGMTKIRYGLYGLGLGYGLAADKASFLQDQIDAVANGSAVSRDKIAGYAEQLYKTGLRAGNLQAALEGMTITASTQGDEQAQRFAGMAAGARMAGISVKKLADDVKARLGGIAAKQALGLDVQLQKLHESFAALFKGLKIDPLLEGLKQVTDLFKQNTVEGLALADLLSSVFQPLIDGAPTAGLLVRKAVQGMIIAALELQSTWLDVELAYYRAFGNTKILGRIDLVKVAVYAGAAAFGTFAALAGATAVALASVAASVALFAAPFILLGALIGAAGFELAEFTSSAWHYGEDFVSGVTNGISRGAIKLYNAVGDLGHRAAGAFRKALGINSPSRVMFRAGGDTADGAIYGVRAKRSAVERAVHENIARPMVEGAGEMSAGGGGFGGGGLSGGGGRSITFSGPIHIGNAMSIEDVKEGLRQGVERLLGSTLIMAGGGAVG